MSVSGMVATDCTMAKGAGARHRRSWIATSLIITPLGSRL